MNVEYVELSHEGVAVRASVVPAGATLALTGEVFPTTADGVVVKQDVEGQLDGALANLETVLNKVGASAKTLARLNLYAETPEAAVSARKLLDARLKCPVSAVVRLVRHGVVRKLEGRQERECVLSECSGRVLGVRRIDGRLGVNPASGNIEPGRRIAGHVDTADV